MGWETSQTRLVKQLRRERAAGERVLKILARVPRDMFVDEEHRHLAFANEALPIGWDQTISQPAVVAVMTEALDVSERHHVLEIGTGSGYQAAVLAELAGDVSTIERNPHLAQRARRVLDYLGYKNVEVMEGDGSLGLIDRAPFDRILVAAAAPSIPQPLIDQLAPGGRLVIPVGGRGDQQLLAVTRDAAGQVTERPICSVRFVPLIGAQAWQDSA